MNDAANCPCGSGHTYTDCCGPYLAGEKSAPTAEALMRSRYTAHVRLNIPYILATSLQASDPRSVARLQSWASRADWKQLKVIDRVAGGTNDDTGIVEFQAWYVENGKLECLAERSNFVRKEGKWIYTDGSHDGKDWRKKIGRNDPCPCGSGRKFKKCHG